MHAGPVKIYECARGVYVCMSVCACVCVCAKRQDLCLQHATKQSAGEMVEGPTTRCNNTWKHGRQYRQTPGFSTEWPSDTPCIPQCDLVYTLTANVDGKSAADVVEIMSGRLVRSTYQVHLINGREIRPREGRDIFRL